MTVEQRRTQPQEAPDFSGYQPVRCLGKGSQGQVWLVRNSNTEQLLAAKCYPPRGEELRHSEASGKHRDSSASRHNESEITPEWRVLANYDHPHLMTFQGIVELSGEWAGGKALLTNYAPGGSLWGLVAARGPLSVGETVTTVTPLGQVLSYLQGQGIAHGDISPANVLFTAHGKPLLADLGFSTLLGEGAVAGAGTVGFTAPEGAGTAEADIFSLAALTWFALTGNPPPITKDRMPLTLIVESVPSTLAAAIEAGLAERAEDRPSAAAFAQAIFRSAKAEPVELSEAVHPSVMPELLTRRQRQPESKLGKKWGLSLRWIGSVRKGRGLANLVPGAARSSRRRGHWKLGLLGLLGLLVVTSGTFMWNAGRVQNAEAKAAQQATSQAAAPKDETRQSPQAGMVELMRGLPAEVRRGLVANEVPQALAAIAWVRSHALASGRLELLELVNEPGSPAAKADEALAATLKQSGHRFSGFNTDISHVTVIKSTHDSALVGAHVQTSAYLEQDSKGSVVQSQDKAQTQQLNFTLTNVKGQWFIQEVHTGS